MEQRHLAIAGGALATVAGLAAILLGRDEGLPVVGSGALGILGGTIAMLGRGRLVALAAADAFVALALMAAMFGWGLPQIPPLLVLLIATVMTPAEQTEEVRAPTAVATTPVRQRLRTVARRAAAKAAPKRPIGGRRPAAARQTTGPQAASSPTPRVSATPPVAARPSPPPAPAPRRASPPQPPSSRPVAAPTPPPEARATTTQRAVG